MNYADYGPIDLPIILRLTVAAASPWRLNNDGTVTGGFWTGGPSNFYTNAFAGYIGAHVGRFHGTLGRDGNGSGQPPQWNGEARDVAMYIGDADNNYLSPNTPYAVGSKIGLTLNPASENPTDIVWTIGDTVLKNYTQTVPAGTITTLEDADLHSNAVSYYYFNGGSKTVSVAYKVRGKPGTGTLKLDVKSPTLVSFTSTTGGFILFRRNRRDILCFGTFTPANPPGLDWNAEVKGPEIFSGSFKFLQLTAPDKAYQLDPTLISPSTDANGWKHLRMDYALDNRLSYLGAAPVPVPPSQTVTGGNDDSPTVGVNINRAIKFVLKDKFQLYCMYKPNTPNAIWVAVGRLVWACDGSVSRATKFDPWGPTSGGAVPVNPSGTAYNGLPPEWTNVVINSAIPFVPGP